MASVEWAEKASWILQLNVFKESFSADHQKSCAGKLGHVVSVDKWILK